MKNYKYIYGPVPSWRLGRSLGIDPVSGKVKICSFDCIYCQLGKTKLLTDKRRVFVPTSKIIKEIKSLPPIKIDYITLSGAGEPTLAKNLGQIIRAIKRIRKVRQRRQPKAGQPLVEIRLWRKKIAILTNSSLINRKDVQTDLLLADFVILKLDAHSQDLFNKINRPVKTIKLNKIIKGMKRFKARFRGKIALQIMFIRKNKKYAEEIAKIAREIKPDEIHINTPLRTCGVKPLSKSQLNEIKQHFKGLRSISVYDVRKKKVKPISKKATLKRRGK